MSESNPPTITDKPDNLYDAAIMLLRSWVAWFDTQPRSALVANLIKDTRALLRDEAQREVFAADLCPTGDAGCEPVAPNEREDAISRIDVVAECERFLENLKGRSDDRRDGAFVAITRLARNIAALPTVQPLGEQPAKSYVDGVDDAQFIVVEALRGTRENYITTNRALEITDAAIKALKQGRDYKHLVSSPAEAMKAALEQIASRYHADTCSHALVEEHECNCHVSIAKAALQSVEVK